MTGSARDHLMPPITDEEHARRREAVNFARGSVRFEGIVLSAEAEVLAERFINGEITLEEHTRRGIELTRREREQRELQALIETSLNLDKDPAVAAAYAAIGARPGAVGYDEQGQLVERQADGSLQVLPE